MNPKRKPTRNSRQKQSMFTGIVQGTARVVIIRKTGGRARLELELGALGRGLKKGASVAVGGVCLTATAVKNGRVGFDLIASTLKRTTLGVLRSGESVNIERAARFGDEIGGHRVSGHITATAVIVKVARPSGNRILTVRTEPAWRDFILPQGFIALDGCSLTVVDVGRDFFTVQLIPETLWRTTFGQKKAGDRVNLELDPETVAVVITVKRYLSRRRI